MKLKINIFGYDFVENNKGKCSIIFEDKVFELTEDFELKNINSIISIIRILNFLFL